MRAILLFAFLISSAPAQLGAGGATPSFKGSLPPMPTADLSTEQQSEIEKELAAVTESFQEVKKHGRAADAAIFIKAVRYALDFHEWYDRKPGDGMKKALGLLAEARMRIQALRNNETPWMNGSGWKVLGFYSKLDDSPQPYGVEIPEGLEFGPGKLPVPMWIWLHGRGDTATDLHFIYQHLTAKKPGQFQPKGTIVIHPFGRYCNGWKSAGETDVFEARDDAKARYNIDGNRIALAGFSMGGAGAWHLGAHYADQWACVHTGAGFVDVKRYNKLRPENYPPWYEQKLWAIYDVPGYARNFFNVPLVCYSGEFDLQRDSAEYMMEVLGNEGLHPPHLIGPGTAHKYHPETIKEVQRLIGEAVAKGRDPWPKKVTLQTRCLRYNKMFWVRIKKFLTPWEDARIDAAIDDAGKVIKVTTKNVAMFNLDREEKTRDYQVVINGMEAGGKGVQGYVFRGDNANDKPQWLSVEGGVSSTMDQSGWRQMGPIDFAFQNRFVIVLPDRPGKYPRVDQWVAAESQHFISRWRGLMRGDPKVVEASELHEGIKGIRILWGDPTSNSEIEKIAGNLAMKWAGDKLTMGSQTFDAATHIALGVPGWAAPNHLEMAFLNSGLTFREAHDKTNSLQNPKLPDWAILDITQPPDAATAGKVVAADFFDEERRREYEKLKKE